jgi:hypothetical protein
MLNVSGNGESITKKKSRRRRRVKEGSKRGRLRKKSQITIL